MRAHETYFTADTHFFHKKMLSERGFESIEEMHRVIIERWNSVVARRDHVYHLGDFAFGVASQALAILKQLNGNIHLIKGNHDSVAKSFKQEFESFQDYKHLKIYDNQRKEKKRIMLFHYPIQVWDSIHHGSWHLHGHNHGSLAERRGYKTCDVGMDCWNLTPVKYEQIRDKFNGEFYKYYTPIDHHNIDTN